MKNFKKVLALVLAVVMLLSFATVASAVTSDYYKDADDINYTEAVDVLGAIGVLNGFPDDTFRPEATITRAQAAKIIAMFDNKSSSINGLYTSANPFSDCVGHWAESYIAYGAKTGIIAGVGGDKFAPEANVTGVQFLKMVLVVLGYDAKAEGLEGKNWDVNTLALAKRVGLIDSLTVKFDFSADLTREQAAVIMLDALRADVVEYGSKLGWNGTTVKEWPYVTGGTVYWTVTGAVSTGDKLGYLWKLVEGFDTDAFMRPLRTWKLNGTVIGTYMYPVVAEFTTAYSACDLLVELGIAKSNTTSSADVIAAWINGTYANEYDMYGSLKHTKVSAHDDCKMIKKVEGAQGTLTQVFKLTGDEAKEIYNDNAKAGYYVTEIDTFLAKVEDVYKKNVNQDGHLTATSYATLEVKYGDDGRNICINETVSATTADSLKKGDMVLVSLSTNDRGTAYYVEAANAKTGRFSGQRTNKLPDMTYFDEEWIANSQHFHFGYNEWAGRDYGTKTVYFDRYGNVIGMMDPVAAADQYLTINRMFVKYDDNGEAVAYADVVTLDGKLTRVTLNTINGKTAAQKWAVAMREEEQWYGTFTNYYHKLYTYSVNDKGLYSVDEITTGAVPSVVVKTGKAYMTDTTGAVIYKVDKDTQFLLHNGAANYKAYTGFAEIPSMLAAKMQYVDNDGDGYADVVYLCDPKFANATFYAYAPGYDYEEIKTVNGVKYLGVIVFVDGVETKVYINEADPNWAPYLYSGWYKLTYRDAGDIEYVEVETADATVDKLNSHNGITAVGKGTIEIAGHAYTFADDIKVYYFNEDRKTVSVADDEAIANLAVGDVVTYLTDGGDVLTELYIWTDYTF